MGNPASFLFLALDEHMPKRRGADAPAGAPSAAPAAAAKRQRRNSRGRGRGRGDAEPGGAASNSAASSLDGGGMLLCIHLDGSLGTHLAAALMPDAVAALPMLGPIVTTVIEWVPTALLAGLCVGAALEGR